MNKKLKIFLCVLAVIAAPASWELWGLRFDAWEYRDSAFNDFAIHTRHAGIIRSSQGGLHLLVRKSEKSEWKVF